MGNDQSLNTWQQPGTADIARYTEAAAKDGLYGNCPATFQQAKLAAELSRKAMQALQKRVLAEYPYVGTVQESMVVCDNRQPDCPIVYVNDEFEKLTLYPKEEIIGRNCRFLQGRYTTKATVRKIRHAVDNGLPLDIELFNYRKDGTGFFNNFLMLPVHLEDEQGGGGGSKVVTHFLAIQKDITLVKKDTNAKLWAPPECAMWFEFLNMGKYAELLVENDVDGMTLLTLNDDDMQSLGIDDAADRASLLNFITKLQRRPEAAYRVLTCKTSTCSTSSSYEGASIDEVDVAAPQNQQIWCREGDQDKTTSVKCYYKDQIAIFRSEDMKFGHINKLIENTWHMPMKLKYTQGSGAEEKRKTLRNAAQWQKALKECRGHIKLQLTKRPREVAEAIAKAYDALAVAVLLVDWEGVVLYANAATKPVLGRARDQLVQLSCTEVFPGIELPDGQSGEKNSTNGKWRPAAVAGKKTKKNKSTVHMSISVLDEMTLIIQAVPLSS